MNTVTVKAAPKMIRDASGRPLFIEGSRSERYHAAPAAAPVPCPDGVDARLWATEFADGEGYQLRFETIVDCARRETAARSG